MTDSAVDIQGRNLKLSNLEKVLYPAVGFTKKDVIDYYARIAPAIIPHLAGRALTRLKSCRWRTKIPLNCGRSRSRRFVAASCGSVRMPVGPASALRAASAMRRRRCSAPSSLAHPSWRRWKWRLRFRIDTAFHSF